MTQTSQDKLYVPLVEYVSEETLNDFLQGVNESNTIHKYWVSRVSIDMPKDLQNEIINLKPELVSHKPIYDVGKEQYYRFKFENESDALRNYLGRYLINVKY